MISERQWVIINLSPDSFMSEDYIIDADVLKYDRRPRFVHDDKTQAETELLRLKSSYPADEFYLFESVAYARPLSDSGEYCVQDMPQ